MCPYTRITYRCGHSELIPGPNCDDLRDELARVGGEAALLTPEGRKAHQFVFPESCNPGEHNTTATISNRCCSWGCHLTTHAATAANTSADQNTEHVTDTENTCMPQDFGFVERNSDVAMGNVSDNTKPEAAAGVQQGLTDRSMAEGVTSGLNASTRTPDHARQEGAGQPPDNRAFRTFLNEHGAVQTPYVDDAGEEDGEDDDDDDDEDSEEEDGIIREEDWLEDGKVFD
ncbi:hypothetical protein F5Y06DRAFT_308255 [Hypoxylon sp. FL0890]|nr:hypothetical protein F5Y06DRAFT_308255 [Hypoxylon sp. FL0890]